MRSRFSNRGALLVLLAAAVLGACGTDPESGASGGGGGADHHPTLEKDVTGSEDIAEELASIHEGSPIVEKRLIGRYARALDRLESKCRERRRRLGDLAVYSAWQLRRQKGIERKPLELLESVRNSVRASPAPTRCREIFIAEVRSTGK